MTLVGIDWDSQTLIGVCINDSERYDADDIDDIDSERCGADDDVDDNDDDDVDDGDDDSGSGFGALAPPDILQPWRALDGDASVDQRVEQFNACGLTTIDSVVDIAEMNAVRVQVMAWYEAMKSAAIVKSSQRKKPVGWWAMRYTNFKRRDGQQDGEPSRMDMGVETFINPLLKPLLTVMAPWMPLVYGILGSDAELVDSGCMISFPGSKDQNMHRDGDADRTDATDIATHVLNVFVPLVVMKHKYGVTEFVPASHLPPYTEYDGAGETVAPVPAAGSAIVFDYRIMHRGLANLSNQERVVEGVVLKGENLARPVLYFTYADADGKDAASWNSHAAMYSGRKLKVRWRR